MNKELENLTLAYLYHPEMAASSFLAFLEFHKERLFTTELSWEDFLEQIHSSATANLMAYKQSLELAKLETKH